MPRQRPPVLAVLLGILAAAGLVGLGRVTAPAPAAARARGYHAGANDAFSGYDGGWSLGQPYLIVLAKGGNGIAYRIAAPARCPEATTTTYAGGTPTSLLACRTGR